MREEQTAVEASGQVAPVNPVHARRMDVRSSSGTIRKESMKKPHFVHVREHLSRVRDGYSFIPDPEAIYLGRQEENHFWELIGLRLQGCPVVVLAALRFERQDRVGVPDARESLASYLSSDESPGGSGRLTAILPNKDQDILAFLSGLRAGREFCPVSFDRMRVELAFDFRADNPSAVRGLKEIAAPLRQHYYRTVSGHVFRGESHQVETLVGGPEARFLAVRAPEQLLPQGVIRMPTLIVAHRFVGLQVDVTEEAARLAVRNWVPFQSSTASREGLIPVG
jgi:hypothetical protein